MKKKRKKEQQKLKVVYKQSKDVSKEEAQRRLSTAYDILFNEVLKRRSE